MSIYANNGGLPENQVQRVVEVVDVIDSQFTTSIPSVRRKHVSLTTPLTLSSGTYWIGMSHTTATDSLIAAKLKNGSNFGPVAQFCGADFVGLLGTEDSVPLQVEGTVVPLPAALGGLSLTGHRTA